jgi:formate/nitrite transporter
MNVDALLPAEIALRAQELGQKKAAMDAPRTLVLAVLAGAFVGLGAAFSTTATAGLSIGWGLERLVAGATFSLGLVLVIAAGAELFTGNALIVMAVAGGKVGLRALLRNWSLVYLGNFAGAAGLALLVWLSGQPSMGGGAVAENALRTAAAKCRLDFVPALALGVLCNLLVCLAVWLCLGARGTGDRILAVLFPVTAFVACGFEHSVANMYFVPLGLLIGGGPPELTWGRFLAGNLLPVTVGNVIGGAVLVGLVYAFVYLRKAD